MNNLLQLHLEFRQIHLGQYLLVCRWLPAGPCVRLLVVTPPFVLDDDTDNRVIECAVTAQAQFLVTGDAQHLLPLGSHARGLQ